MAPRPKLLALTGASNVTGWLPPAREICEAAHARGSPCCSTPRNLLRTVRSRLNLTSLPLAGTSYAPYGAGALIGPRRAFASGDPFLAGGGAVDLVDLDEVIWTDPPDREEAGSPNVIGAVAFAAAMDALTQLGWDTVMAHEAALSARLHEGLRAIDGVEVLGPPRGTDTLSVAAFNVEGMHHAVGGRSPQRRVGCRGPPRLLLRPPVSLLLRLLGVGREGVAQARARPTPGNGATPGRAVRASCGLGTSAEDVDTLLDALRALTSGDPAPVPYVQDAVTGDFWPAAMRSVGVTRNVQTGHLVPRG